VLLTEVSKPTTEYRSKAAKLILQSPPDGVSEVPLNIDRFIIGREAGSVDRVSPQTGVSRMHCEWIRGHQEEGMYSLRDLGSRNGTFLNGEPLIPFKAYPMKDGDRIRIVQEEYEYKED
jgi:pSer/pThr/pTyr-binding forkhead associated (FHA) protein